MDVQYRSCGTFQGMKEKRERYRNICLRDICSSVRLSWVKALLTVALGPRIICCPVTKLLDTSRRVS